MAHPLRLDGDLRDAGHRASVHHFFERYYHCVSQLLGFQDTSSRRFSVSESFFHLTVLEGCYLPRHAQPNVLL